MLTDSEGNIHGINDNCTSMLGLPNSTISKQLSINDNLPLNIN
jgi:hypothetical protein